MFNPSRPEKTIPVGPKVGNHSLHSSMTSGTTFSSCLDEAVSFDFGTPFEDTRSSGDQQKRVKRPPLYFELYPYNRHIINVSVNDILTITVLLIFILCLIVSIPFICSGILGWGSNLPFSSIRPTYQRRCLYVLLFSAVE